jgi:phosphoribosylaminoimidazole-succinocarboxamide synthase
MHAKEEVLLTTDFRDLTLLRRGKVRDVYDLGDSLLIVSTDRISAFDVVLPCGIPYKGKVLNAISLFWFDYIKGIVPHHLITAEIGEYPQALQKYSQAIAGRSMLVKKTRSLPVECVVRGYLSGSGWKDYQKNRSVCGIPLPEGLRESDKLAAPLFTPSTKADVGHDLNVSQDYIKQQVGSELAQELKEKSIAIYEKASDYARTRGIIIADTKFEFGLLGSQLILIDEVLTPDSSRFWPKNEYAPGAGQPSFDKQFVRDYLEGLDWNKQPPGPELPSEVIVKTSQKYLDAYAFLVGKPLVA